MADVYTFDDDLDRSNPNIPEDARAGLTVHDDTEHFVFGLAGGGTDNREIYLSPGDAENLAALLIALTYTEDHDPEGENSRAVQVVASVCTLALMLGALVGLVYGVVAALVFLV